MKIAGSSMVVFVYLVFAFCLIAFMAARLSECTTGAKHSRGNSFSFDRFSGKGGILRAGGDAPAQAVHADISGLEKL